MKSNEQLIEKFESDPIERPRGLRGILTDSCLIWMTIIITAVSVSIIAHVTVDYYQLCVDNQNLTECLN